MVYNYRIIYNQMNALFYRMEWIAALMFLHCIYEAGNPLLVPLLGSSIALKGDLNGSDLLALQSVFQTIKNSGLSHNIEALNLTAATSLTDMDIVIKAIESVKMLTLSIGNYNETLVKCIFNKSLVRRLKYDWIIWNEEARIESCTSFCKFLEHNKSLQVLDLSCVPLRDVGARELAKVLNTTQLVELNLSRCGIETEGIEELFEALESNSCLRNLHLHETIITPSALESLSRLLIKNNTLTTVGMVEEPLASELSPENLQDFIARLCFNSSVTCLMLHGILLHTPSLVQALTLVNITRKLKQQPLLSIDDHFPKNYSPDLYNEFGIRPWELRMKELKSINDPIIIASNGCYLMEQLPTQVWMQTLSVSLNFITEMKVIRNVSVQQILKPKSKAILVNIDSRKFKEISKTVAMVEGHRILFPEKELPLQEQQGTLCASLQFITRFKTLHTVCVLRSPLPRDRVRRKDVLVQVNGTLRDPTSQYPAVVEALQTVRPFSSQQWQQTLFCTQQFIGHSKTIRNMCTRKLIGSCKTISIRISIQHHRISSSNNISSILSSKTCINLEKEVDNHVHTAKCMSILVSVANTVPYANTPLQVCALSTTNNVLLYPTADFHLPVPGNLISEYCERYKISPTPFSILLSHLLQHISILLTY